MTEPILNGEPEWSLQTPPPLPPGYDKHHIVMLEAVHLALPPFIFPHTIDNYQRTRPDEVAERIKPATIVISNVVDVNPAAMENAPHLQLLAVYATGFGWVDKQYCARRGITVMNCPSANIPAVSEHFLALYFASRKRVPMIDHIVKTSDEWVRTNSLAKRVWPQGPTLGCQQETLGIVGYGALGKRIEMLCRSIGFKEVLIAERKGSEEVREGRVTFEDMLKRSTTVVLVCPREPDTIDLIGDVELKMMRREALLVNMSRGGIVNEAALSRALKGGWIFGAATDVLDKEPGGPGTTPLLPDLSKGEEPVPNLVISSHVAWFSGQTIETLQGIMKRNLEGFVEGRLYDPKVKGSVAVHDGRIWKLT
ncbi:hypothetical protein H2198_002565 [Neophaeococcomyces mojaviensis]|uniref:Uncharacterized protein n=1 Tax=Neophaeococcomyces mojaviensis TaxID=3383035 RepID=A0ACC3AEH3_9EURO|nr:hypothetical protein H2198_002565 [Knufia sp. JES_112]